MKEFQIKIVSPISVSSADKVEIFCIHPGTKEFGEEFTEVTYDPDSRLLNVSVLKDGEQVKPLIVLPKDIFAQLCKAALEYAKDKQIPIQPEKSFTEGKLLATEKNLEHLQMNFDKLINKLIK